MSKSFATIALIAALTAMTAVPDADAGPRRHIRGHHAYDHGGRGRAPGGPWIVSLVGAARDADHGNCYTRYGRRFCE